MNNDAEATRREITFNVADEMFGNETPSHPGRDQFELVILDLKEMPKNIGTSGPEIYQLDFKHLRYRHQIHFRPDRDETKNFGYVR